MERTNSAHELVLESLTQALLLLMDENLDLKWVMAGGRVIRDFDAPEEA